MTRVKLIVDWYQLFSTVEKSWYQSTINLTLVELEIRQGRVVFYMKPGRAEMYYIYLMYFENSIRFALTIVLSQITRKASRKSDIDKNIFYSEQSLWSKNVTKMLTSSN